LLNGEKEIVDLKAEIERKKKARTYTMKDIAGQNRK
jgi:hypothetical protein